MEDARSPIVRATRSVFAVPNLLHPTSGHALRPSQRASAVLSDAPPTSCALLCTSVLLPSFEHQRAALLPPVESQDLLSEESIICSPLNRTFCTDESTKNCSCGDYQLNNNQSIPSIQSTQCYSSPSCSSSPFNPSFSTVNSPSIYPLSPDTNTPSSTCSSPSNHPILIDEFGFIYDWRDWIDEIIDEVRSEMRSETIFNHLHKNQSQKSHKTTSKKRKHSDAISIRSDQSIESTSSSSSSSPSHSSSSDESGQPKRAKKYSLASLTYEQVAERKKEQNRIAAQRYRSRKTQTLEEGRTEIGFLEKRNADLRLEMYALKTEIQQLKKVLVGDQSQSPCSIDSEYSPSQSEK